MKRLIVFFCVILFASGLAWGARGPADVSTGPHNLSGDTSPTPGPNPGNYNTDEDSICVFCHTPHGGSLDAPLWNRTNPSHSNWKHYNSATMSTTLKGLSTSRAPGIESMLCLSCHDGSISINHVINAPNDNPIILSAGGVSDTTIVDFFGNPGARTGSLQGSLAPDQVGFLNDDHPISFSYTAVEQSNEYLLGAKQGQLQTTYNAVTFGDVRFFGGADNLECPSCHDPHVNYVDNPEYTGFLITPNTGSALCFACHVK
jgi:hypothetical protein